MGAADTLLSAHDTVARADSRDEAQWICAVVGFVLHHDNVQAVGWLEHTNDWDLRIRVTEAGIDSEDMLDDVSLVFQGANIGNGDTLRRWINDTAKVWDPDVMTARNWELRVADDQWADEGLSKVRFYNLANITALTWTEA